MNRLVGYWPRQSPHVPRERGDEPAIRKEISGLITMFPASAGMNRKCSTRSRHGLDVPRERGDEPIFEDRSPNHHEDVPRERGDEPPSDHYPRKL